MSSIGRHVNKATRIKRSVPALLVIAAMTFPISPSEAEVAGAHAKRLVGRAVDLLRKSGKSSDTPSKPRQIESQSQREDRVTHVRLCPRRLLLYVGEQFTLVPLPLDRNKEVVHGVAFAWESSDSDIADAASDGSVTALKSGKCSVTASVGNKKDKVNIEVREGHRPLLTNSEWDIEHGHDCDDPEQSTAGPANDEPTISSFGSGSRKGTITPAVVSDPDDPVNVGSAGSTVNATGDPRFTPAEVGIQKAKNQLGSSNFGLNIPIFGSPGRGVDMGVSLAYNSRVWTRDENTNKMVFDYDQGWPAPGFRLNYGRIIPDFDAAPGFHGNYLLIEADGTRTPLIAQVGTIFRSNDGRFVEFDINNNSLSYPDGTIVFYVFNGSKLVPNQIRDVNGNSIAISYVTSCSDAQRTESCTCGVNCVRPPRQAINQISDTLGRLVTFYYKADGNLAEIRVAGYNGGADRTVARFSYQPLTLAYDFGTMNVVNVPVGNQVDVLRRVYFPDTGRGYVFEPYSSYGMCTKVSMRLGMTDGSDGTVAAFTEYLYQTTGVLSDSPQFTERHEWWQGKTDDQGVVQDSTHPAVFTYGRTVDNSTTWVIAQATGIKSESLTINNAASSLFGLVATQRMIRVSDNAVLAQSDFTYNDRTSTSGLQRTSVTATDDGSPANQTRSDSIFGQYGRLLETVEYGFPISASFKKRRRTVYSYLDTADYTNLALYRLVNDVTVYDAHETNSNGDDTPIARTGFVYDTSDAGWEIAAYGFTKNCSPSTNPPCTPPPGYNTKFVDRAFRGLVTKTQLWTNANAPAPNFPDISFRHAFDIFGNELKAEVSCCSLKRNTFSAGAAGMYYSLPMSATDGPISGPNLSTSFAYDFNTSFLNSATDPNNLVTSFAPDAAMRVKSVTQPSGALAETFFADPSYPGKDGLVYQSKLTYMDGASQKIQVSNQWLDGAGRAVRAGSAAGASPTSFDAVKTIYDDLGRLRKTINPYVGDSNGNITGLPNATIYDYDDLSRVKLITLPDGNTITTNYNGVITTVTDQAGRQRRAEVDGLGRTIKVTEMDDSKLLNWNTTYGYDLNDNLISIDQGSQTRGFKYDSLSRMTFERTPEQDATINDGSGTFWSAHYTHTSFNAIDTREDARHVITNYSYDGLNRLYQVAYTLPSPNPDNVQATAAVNITYGTAAPKLGQAVEIKQTDGTNTPWKENYDYDSLSRVSSKTVSLDNQAYSYTTGYGYNQAGQLAQMTYPSTKVVKYGFDNRGRLNAVGDASVATKYVSSVGYNPSQQIGSIGLGNGVNESYGYSADRLQLTSHTATKSGNTLMSLTCSYVAAKSRSGGVGTGTANTGQLMDITGTIKDPSGNTLARNESYSYDQVSRLSQASGFYAQRNYSYDRFGNRIGVSGGSSQSVTLQQPGGGVTNNRIANVNGGSNYTYDAAGNTTFDAVHGFTYDAENRIVKVDSGSTATYFYDSANRRVKKVVGTGASATTNYYIWEGSSVIAEYGNAPAGSGGTRFYHPDRLSNRVITDDSGVVKGTQDHLPFGEDGGVVGESEKHRFTSYERDAETASDYAINRQHQFPTGRFMSPDPADGSIAEPQSLNRYAYVQNDPINLTDPLGLYYRITCSASVGVSSIFDSKRVNVSIGVTCTLFSVGLREPGGKGAGGKDATMGPKKIHGTPPRCSLYDSCPTMETKIEQLFVSIGIRLLQNFVLGPNVGHDQRIEIEKAHLEECLGMFAEKVIKGECGLTPRSKSIYDRAARRVDGRLPSLDDYMPFVPLPGPGDIRVPFPSIPFPSFPGSRPGRRGRVF